MPGSVTITHYTLGNIRRINFSIVADAAAATVPDTVLPKFQGRLIGLHTNPGATAPTDNYDITLEDADGLDRLQGVGANRHTTTSQQVPVVYSGTSVNPPVSMDETLTLKVANNAVNSALIVGNLYYSLGD
jgi:hypothetical protein